MAYIGGNSCEPERIFGPLPQTLFCGLTVKNFSVSVGFNEQSSSLTVELVEDTCSQFTNPRTGAVENVTKYYWDAQLNRQIWTQADPGFLEPEPGTPAYFRIEENPEETDITKRGGFEYCGIIESWNVKYDSSNNPLYYVKMTDPRSILANAELILSEYVEDTQNIYNLINIYGYLESIGYACPNSPAGGIGGVTLANTAGNIANERGIVWNDVKCSLHTLCSSISPDPTKDQYCRAGRLVHVGSTVSGFGILPTDFTLNDLSYLTIPNANLNACSYVLDLSEIPFTPTYYRVSGPNISLSDLIGEVCSASGCDYFIELVPVKVGGSVLKIIKIRVIKRGNQPQSVAVDQYVTARRADNSLISYARGEELRNEDTSVFIPGGNIRDPYSVTQENILPFWGIRTDGFLHQAYIDASGYYSVDVDFLKASTSLNNPLPNQYMNIHELEILAALGGFETWKEVSILRSRRNPISVTPNLIGHWLTGVDMQQASALDTTQIAPVIKNVGNAANVKIGLNFSDKKVSENQAADANTIFNFIQNYANEYYGKQFLVNASDIACYAVDSSYPDSPVTRFSYEPSTEGCWVADGTAKIGNTNLTHNTSWSDTFRDDQGKYSAFLEYNSSGIALSKSLTHVPQFSGDFKGIGDASKTVSGTKIFVKAGIDPRWILGTNLFPTAETASLLLTIESPAVAAKDPFLNLNNNQAGITLVNEINITQDKFSISELAAYEGVETQILNLSAGQLAMHPVAAMAPVLNNVETYGPWGKKGLPGSITYTSDSSYVPWEFGSDTIMNAAALESVTNAVTQMRKGERGSVTVSAFPNIPIGAELLSAGTLGLQGFVETRTFTLDGPCANASATAYYNVALGASDGTYGPTITSMNISVGPNGFTTSYEFSTYVPQFGQFQKKNAERLRKIGKDRLNQNRQLRAFQKLLATANIGTSASASKNPSAPVNKGGGGGGAGGQAGGQPRADQKIGNVTVAQYSKHAESSSRSPKITSQHADQDALRYASQNVEGWNRTAFVSQDWFFRPVSVRGGMGQLGASTPATGKLSRFPAFKPYISEPADTPYLFSNQPNPPYMEYTGLAINRDYLNPLSQSGTDLLNDRSTRGSSSGVGFDIDIVAHAQTGYPTGALSTDKRGYDPTFDYKFMAMRGPLVIQQWGYDINNKPIPNEVDDYGAAISGNFQHTGITDKFMSGWLKRPKAWPVAPLDLRFDRSRGLWTVPQPPRIIHVDYSGCGTGDMTGIPVLNPTSGVYSSGGDHILEPRIQSGLWPWSIDPPSGMGVTASYFDVDEGKQYLLPYNRLDVNKTGEARYKDIKVLEFGPGLTPHKKPNHTIRIVLDSMTTTTTSTTTTLAPDVPPDGDPGVNSCAGECEWQWDDLAKSWTLITNGCFEPTTTTTIDPFTTTSTTPPTTSTTTTSDPICPPEGTDGKNDVTTTTSTTTSTTTTEAPCCCPYPLVCGEVDGEYSFTACGRYGDDCDVPPECTTTTTSTTLEPTTTTTCDPETSSTCPPTTTPCPDGPDGYWCTTQAPTTISPPSTTTPDPDFCNCDGNCTWQYIASSFGCFPPRWVQISSDCPYCPTFANCNTKDRGLVVCCCSSPDLTAELECGDCVSTECTTPPPTTTQEPEDPCPPGCCGDCQWEFVCFTPGGRYQLVCLFKNCFTGLTWPGPPYTCDCRVPRIPETCNTCDKSACLVVETPCEQLCPDCPGSSTTPDGTTPDGTTTPPGSTTTELPCDPCNPSAECCSSTTTTTTEEPCDACEPPERCRWVWDATGGEWVQDGETPCCEECPCHPPIPDGKSDGEVDYTSCGFEWTTTTTTTSTTTTSTTTTSTTTTTTTSGPTSPPTSPPTTTPDPCSEQVACCDYPAADSCSITDRCTCEQHPLGRVISSGDCADCLPSACEGESCSYTVVLVQGPNGVQTCQLEPRRTCPGACGFAPAFYNCGCVVNWDEPDSPFLCPVGDIIIGICECPSEPPGGEGPSNIVAPGDDPDPTSASYPQIQTARQRWGSNVLTAVAPGVADLDVTIDVPGEVDIYGQVIKPAVTFLYPQGPTSSVGPV